MRLSIHREPVGATAIARHYIRDMVYGANDGVIRSQSAWDRTTSVGR
jgi:hypothetical protein